METTQESIVCEVAEQIPTLEQLRAIPRGVTYKIIFGEELAEQRHVFEKQWKNGLPDFYVSSNPRNFAISLLKLLSKQDIEQHQDFFEKCAKDYRNLATKLITDLAITVGVNIEETYPLIAFGNFNGDILKQTGVFQDWNYFFHGLHCGFTNQLTQQHIEVSLNFGLEFGELNPSFFVNYILTTPNYAPLPIFIHKNYSYLEGQQILHKMVELGKFELINSNMKDEYGIVVTDREKIPVKVLPPEEIFNSKIRSR